MALGWDAKKTLDTYKQSGGWPSDLHTKPWQFQQEAARYLKDKK